MIYENDLFSVLEIQLSCIDNPSDRARLLEQLHRQNLGMVDPGVISSQGLPLLGSDHCCEQLGDGGEVLFWIALGGSAASRRHGTSSD